MEAFLRIGPEQNRDCLPALPTSGILEDIANLRNHISSIPTSTSYLRGEVPESAFVLGQLDIIKAGAEEAERFLLFDSKFQIPNNYYLKLMIMWTYHRMIMRENNIIGTSFRNFQNLVQCGQSVVLIFYDGDGVSGWNNNFDHIKGDEFLQALVQKLNPETNPVVLELLQRFRAVWFFGRFAGDEYCLIIETPGRDITRCTDRDDNTVNLAEEVIRTTQKECEKIDLFDLLHIEKADLAKRIKFPQDVDLGFTMPITVSAGWTLFSPLFLGLDEKLAEISQTNVKSINMTFVLHKLLNWVLSQGSANMEKQKAAFKALLETTRDPQTMFLHYFYSRTDFAQKQIRANLELQKRNRWLSYLCISLGSVLLTIIGFTIWQN